MSSSDGADVRFTESITRLNAFLDIETMKMVIKIVKIMTNNENIIASDIVVVRVLVLAYIMNATVAYGPSLTGP